MSCRVAGSALVAAALLVVPGTGPWSHGRVDAAAAAVGAAAGIPGMSATRAATAPPPAARMLAARAPAASRYWTPTRVLLTPSADPATSQVVSWTMPERLRGQRVQFRVPGGTSRWAVAVRRPATSVRSSGSSRPRYAATLRGLAPGAVHEYRIVTGRGSTSWRRFTTADPAADSVTLIGLGDTQVDNRGVPRTTIRKALAAAPGAALVLHAGDVVNRPYRGSEWADLFAAIGESGRTRNWVVSIGNHEQCVLVLACRSGRAQAFRSYFDWPTNGFPGQGETWFHVDHQGVRIVVLDSFGGRMEQQAAFLDHALATNPHPWSIVLMHASPFASRPGRSNVEVREHWVPIIEAHDVDLVLTGHDHSYARGRRDPAGPVFVQSVSGTKYYEVTDADWAAGGATRDVWAARTATYQVITIAGDTLSYRAVVSHRGSGSTSPVGVGGELDSFTITHGPGGVDIVE